MSETYVQTADLDAEIRDALSAVKYHRKDIAVHVQQSVTPARAGGNGYRAFTILVDLAAHKYEIHWGSWGGANMFNVVNPIDLDRAPRTLPGNGLAIIGRIGGGRPTWAIIFIPPSMVARILPSTAGPELSPELINALYCHTAIKGGAYRREELRRRNVSADTIDQAVALGLILRNKAGACQITTDGRNALAASGHRGY